MLCPQGRHNTAHPHLELRWQDLQGEQQCHSAKQRWIQPSTWDHLREPPPRPLWRVWAPLTPHLFRAQDLLFVWRKLVKSSLKKKKKAVMLRWKSLSHVQLCDPKDCTNHGMPQARTLEWVAFPFTSGSSRPRDWTQISRIAGRFFTRWATREVYVKVSGGCFLNLEILSFYSTVGSSQPWQYCEALSVNMGFPGGTSGKEPACQYGRHKRHKICGFTPWVRKIPWRTA